jgi:hypothetical protein
MAGLIRGSHVDEAATGIGIESDALGTFALP